MTKNQPTTMFFAWAKETPGTHQYHEVDAKGHALKADTGAVIGTLYVRKSALNGVKPERLEVTVTPR